MPETISAGGWVLDLGHIILLLLVLGLAMALIFQRQAAALKRQALALEAEDLRGDLAAAQQRAGEDLRQVSSRLEAAEQALRTQEAVALQAQLALAETKAKSAGDEHRFADLAQSVLARANEHFLQLANETFEKHREGAKGQLADLMNPIRQNMEVFSQKVADIEKVRTEDKSLLQEQVKALGESLVRNTAETGKLVSALTAPKGGGRWGELSLRNVLEQAGLSSHCDFTEQVTDNTDEGRQRPDAIIHLPGDRQIVVDSKVSLDAYMLAANATEPAIRQTHLKAHADSVKRHVAQLAGKDYQSNLGNRFDYIVMFIPGENFFAAALEHVPDLIEKAMAKKVIVTTPTTLIALARTVGHLWRQHDMNQNAMEAARIAEDLYGRLTVMLKHMEKLGNSLNGSVDAFNSVMGSVDKRVMPALRKFEELSIAPPDKTVAEPKRINNRAQVPAKTGLAAPLLDYEGDPKVPAE